MDKLGQIQADKNWQTLTVLMQFHKREAGARNGSGCVKKKRDVSEAENQ